MANAAPTRLRIDASRLREMYADEINGGALFRGLAEHADADQRDVFLTLAAAEERHAAHWESSLRAAGVEPRPPRRPFRVRALCFLARLFGSEAVLPLMLRTEAAEADRYQSDAEATDVMAQQERAAGRTIAAMQGIPTGGRIARSEGRHRGEVGGVLRATVFGVNDGLVSNFSLVMGVAGGTSNNSIVLLAGIAGHRRRRVLDGVGRVDLDPVAARALRERAAHRAGGAAGVPRGGARRARDDLPGQGHHARGRATSSSTRSCAATTSRSTRWRVRSSGSIRRRSARRGWRRGRRSSPSPPAPRSR